MTDPATQQPPATPAGAARDEPPDSAGRQDSTADPIDKDKATGPDDYGSARRSAFRETRPERVEK